MKFDNEYFIRLRALAKAGLYESFDNCMRNGVELSDMRHFTNAIRESADEMDKWIEEGAQNDKTRVKRTGRKDNNDQGYVQNDAVRPGRFG